MKKNQNEIVKILSIILAVLVLVIVSYFSIFQRNIENVTPNPLENGGKFSLERVSKDSDLYYDKRLVYTTPDSKQTVLVPSIKAALPELQEKGNLTLQELSFLENANKLFFRSVFEETDQLVTHVYSYDLSTRQFKKMSVDRFFGYEILLSPDKTKFVSVFDYDGDRNSKGWPLDGKVYVIDLVNDKLFQTIVLGPGESPVQDVRNLGYIPTTKIEWIDNSTIKYAVYNSSNSTLDTEEPARALIGFREFRF